MTLNPGKVLKINLFLKRVPTVRDPRDKILCKVVTKSK